MDGGPSHIDLWDLRPHAPEEIRGPFRPVATTVPGIRVCEHLPLVARQMHHLAQVRSVRHDEAVHDPAVYQMLTGHKHPRSAGGLTVQPSDFPQMGAAFGTLDRSPAVLPRVFELPERMKMDARVLPGQNAGFLGGTHDPLRVTVTPDARVVPPDFRPRADTGRPDRHGLRDPGRRSADGAARQPGPALRPVRGGGLARAIRVSSPRRASRRTPSPAVRGGRGRTPGRLFSL